MHLELGRLVQPARDHVRARALQADQVDGHRVGRDVVLAAPAPLRSGQPQPCQRVQLILLDQPAEALLPAPSPVPADALERAPRACRLGPVAHVSAVLQKPRTTVTLCGSSGGWAARWRFVWVSRWLRESGGRDDGARPVSAWSTGVVVALAAVWSPRARRRSTELHAVDRQADLCHLHRGRPSGHAEIYPGGVTVDPERQCLRRRHRQRRRQGVHAERRPPVDVFGQRGSKAPGNFDNPRDIAYLNGKLYVADLGNKRVQVMDAVTARRCRHGRRRSPRRSASRPASTARQPVILVTQDVKNQVTEFKPDGTPTGRVFGTGTAGNGNGQLKAPRDAATDSAGNVYVADYGTTASSSSAPAETHHQLGHLGRHDGEFRRPYGVDVDVNNQHLRGRLHQPPGADLQLQRHLHRQLRHSAATAAERPHRRPVRDAAPRGRAPGVSHPDIYLADLWGYRVSRVSQDARVAAQLHLRPDVRQRAPDRRRLQRAVRAHVRRRPHVRRRLGQPAHGLRSTRPRMPTRSSGASAAGAPTSSASTGRATSPTWRPPTRSGWPTPRTAAWSSSTRTARRPGAPTARSARRRRAAEPALRDRGGRHGADRGRLHQQPGGADRPGQPDADAAHLDDNGIGNPQDVTIDGTTVLVTDTRNNRLVRLSRPAAPRSAASSGSATCTRPRAWPSTQTATSGSATAPTTGSSS